MGFSIDDQRAVKIQYANSEGLMTRIGFQQRFSQNSYGFGPWLMDQYDFPQGARVLEIGCGTGHMWEDKQDLIDTFGELMLTDFSPGMLKEARQKLSGLRGVQFGVADVQSLPFEDGSYDFIIANMMLYHVPDRPRAIAEIRRVLKPGGTFVCSTYGENGLVPYMKRMLEGILPMREPNTKFTLQNGAEQLSVQFAQVERRDYPDEFIVDDVDAIVRYLLSMTNIIISLGDTYSRELVKAVVQSCMDAEGGKLRIPKEYGTFICQ